MESTKSPVTCSTYEKIYNDNLWLYIMGGHIQNFKYTTYLEINLRNQGIIPNKTLERCMAEPKKAATLLKVTRLEANAP